MGSELSCIKQRKEHRSQKSKNDLRSIIIELSEKHEFIDIPEKGRKDYCTFDEEEQVTNRLINDFSSLKLLDNKIDTYDDENQSNIGSIITERTINSLKRKISQKLSENDILTPEICNDAKLEETYTDEPRNCKISKTDTFLSNPLTLEDVTQILNDSNSNVSQLSPFSFDSPLMTELSKSNELTDFLDSFDDSPEDIIDENEKYSKGGMELKSHASSNPEKHGYKSISKNRDYNFKFKNSEKIGQILNVVPKSYESFIKPQKTEKQNHSEAEISKVESRINHERTHELFVLLYKTNQFRQNILHQLVLTRNYSEIQTVIDCLMQLKTLHVLLEADDIFFNKPFAYAVLSGDMHMTEMLLKCSPEIPKFVYLKTKHNRSPILHTAYQFVGTGVDNLITMICNYLLSINNNETLKDILETHNNLGLTILHHSIVHFTSKQNETKFNIRYLLRVGARLETQCCCPSKKQIKVDALGQAVFSKYPIELLNLLIEFPPIKDFNFKWDYVLDNIYYKLDELVLLRTDIGMNYKNEIINLLEKFK